MFNCTKIVKKRQMRSRTMDELTKSQQEICALRADNDKLNAHVNELRLNYFQYSFCKRESPKTIPVFNWSTGPTAAHTHRSTVVRPWHKLMILSTPCTTNISNMVYKWSEMWVVVGQSSQFLSRLLLFWTNCLSGAQYGSPQYWLFLRSDCCE